MIKAGFRATTDPSVLDEARRRRDLRPDAAGGGRRPGPRRRDRRPCVTVAAHLHPGHARHPGVHDLPRHHRRGGAADPRGGRARRAGVDFHLAFSPERIDPGNPVYGMKNTPKVVGGHDPGVHRRRPPPSTAGSSTRSSGPRAPARPRRPSCWRTPTATSTSRWSTRWRGSATSWASTSGTSSSARATKPFGFQAFYPGPGVGGHCIPIDPNYLSYNVRAKLGYPFRFVELAQEINAGMPRYVVQPAAGPAQRGGASRCAARGCCCSG